VGYQCGDEIVSFYHAKKAATDIKDGIILGWMIKIGVT
jgi:hypothetical protein